MGLKVGCVHGCFLGEIRFWGYLGVEAWVLRVAFFGERETRWGTRRERGRLLVTRWSRCLSVAA